MKKLLKQFPKSLIGIAEDETTEKMSQFLLFYLNKKRMRELLGEF